MSIVAGEREKGFLGKVIKGSQSVRLGVLIIWGNLGPYM